MINIQQFAMNLLQNNPNIAKNPQAQEMLKVIQNGDSQRGQMIAENLCKTYGITKEDALAQAKRFFHI
nr:MAG TPA: Coenzyme PQQ synthesis protein D [Bacteriophage sp.]